MSFIEWWFAVTARPFPGLEEDADTEESVTFVGRGPYRSARDASSTVSRETVEAPFIAVFRSADDVDFTCCVVASIAAPDRRMITHPVIGWITGRLAGRLRVEGRLVPAVDLIVVSRDFVRVVCLGSRHASDEAATAPESVWLEDVRLVAMTVDSGIGRPITFRFDR